MTDEITAQSLTDRVRVACQANPCAATIEVHFDGRRHDLRDVQIRGTVHGPSCLYARTLPATIALRAGAFSPLHTAVSHLPDPCFWSAELPHLYQLQIELVRDGNVVARLNRTLGIRPVSVLGTNLYIAGRRQVLRGADVADRFFPTDDPRRDVTALRRDALVIVGDAFSPEFVEAADRVGLVLMIRMARRAASQFADVLPRMARSPSLLAVILETDDAVSPGIKAACGDVLLACEMTDASQLPPAWADICLAPADVLAKRADKSGGRTIPTIALEGGAELSLSAVRAACDKLQGELADRGDFAGYLVGCRPDRPPDA